MTFGEFDKICDEIFEQVRKMRDTKGKEYARDDADRFANFNRLAKELGLLREQVLWVYAAKHLDAIISYVNMGRVFSNEPIEGRIVDAITYLTLLAGMARENNMQKSISFSGLETEVHPSLLPPSHRPAIEELELSPVQCRCRRYQSIPGGPWITDSDSCPIPVHKRPV